MKQKAFTLIELLVVVAIIGILAAVGVVAYNGYTASAKKAASKINFKAIVSVITNELSKCAIDSSLTHLKLKDRTGKDVLISCTLEAGQISYKLGDHLRGSGFRNPYTGKPEIWMGGVTLKEGEMQITGWDIGTPVQGVSCPNNDPCFHIEVNWDGDASNYLTKTIMDPRG